MAGGRNGPRSRHTQSSATAASSAPPPSTSSSSAPPLPPPLPPPQTPSLDDLVNAPIRIFPLDRPPTRANATTSTATTPQGTLLQCLQCTTTPAVVVGVLASDATSCTGVYTLINRLIGRVAFQNGDVDDSAFGISKPSLRTSIQLYYDPVQSILFLLGVAKPEVDFLASLRVDEMDGTDAHDAVGEELRRFQHDKRKLGLLMHACSHLLFQFNERGKFTASILKHVRSLAAEKQSLLTLLNSVPSGKTTKRNDKASSGGLSNNVLAPGRCVPLVMFVVPARDDVIHATLKQLPAASAIKSRSSTVAFCKSHEAMLCNLFRSLRGGVVGTLRTRDAVAAANLSKERRLFHVDPAHCVAVVSQTSASDTGRVETRFENVLAMLSMESLLHLDSDQTSDLDALLEPLDEDDVGFPSAIQHLHRGVELLQQNASVASASSHSKDTGGVKMELLTVAHWLKAFQALLKTIHRAETKKKQSDAASETLRPGLEPSELRS